jgi:hypothetical protein
MKTLLKLALAGALTVVLVKWARQWSQTEGSAVGDRKPTDGSVAEWEQDAADPLRGENLRVEPTPTQ